MSEQIKTSATGTVMPATPLTSLPAGKCQVTIDKLCEDGLVRVIYPDGLVKHHGVTTGLVSAIDELAVKVVSVLRNRYGVRGDINIIIRPAELAPGVIELEIV